MTTHHLIRLLAGSVTLAGVALTHFVSPWWLAFTAFVGLNLFQSAFSNWCPMMAILRKFGFQ